jgi:hypothetical protein
VAAVLIADPDLVLRDQERGVEARDERVFEVDLAVGAAADARLSRGEGDLP